jgi:hypothetical protein
MTMDVRSFGRDTRGSHNRCDEVSTRAQYAYECPSRGLGARTNVKKREHQKEDRAGGKKK